MNEFPPGRTMPPELVAYKVCLPCRRRRTAAIRHYRIGVRQAEATNWSILMHGDDCAWSYPGRYTSIEIDGLAFASDEAKEIVDYLPFLRAAHGHILLTGLGLGLCLQALLRKEDVEHVTVIERNPDVLAIVAPHYRAMFDNARMTFVEADAFTWQPPRGIRFDIGYHDIWPVAAGFYWPQHEHLFAHYQTFCTEQESWRGQWMHGHYQKLRITA